MAAIARAAITLLLLGGACRVPAPVDHCDEQAPCPEGYLCLPEGGYCVVAEAVTCDRAHPCPDGFHCDLAQHVCAQGTAPPCGTARVFQDPFDDGRVCYPWGSTWAAGNVDGIHEVNGELVFTLDPGQSQVRDFGCSSYRGADLRGEALAVELVQGIAETMQGQATFALVGDEGEEVRFTQSDAGLELAYSLNSDDVYRNELDFDPVEHRWLRLRETEGQLFFETSAAGERWESHLQIVTPGFVSRGRLELRAWASSGQTVSGEVRFADLGAGPEPVTWCPAAILQDAFEAAALSEVWRVSSTQGSCSHRLSNGALQLEATSGAFFACGIESWHGYRLDASGVWFELIGPAPAGAFVGLALEQPHGPSIYYGFAEDQIEIWAAYTPAADNTFQHVEAIADSRWLRVSQQGETIRFERRASADQEWTRLVSASGFALIEAAQIGLLIERADTTSPTTGAIAARLDNVNLP